MLAVLRIGEVHDLEVVVRVVVARRHLLIELAGRFGVDALDFCVLKDAVVKAHIRVLGVHARVDDRDHRALTVNAEVLVRLGNTLELTRRVLALVVHALAAHRGDLLLGREVLDLAFGHFGAEAIDEIPELSIHLQVVLRLPRLKQLCLTRKADLLAGFARGRRLLLQHDDDAHAFVRHGAGAPLLTLFLNRRALNLRDRRR